MRKQFRLDKSHAVAFGVCSGIAEYTGIDATIVRIGVVIATLVGGFPWTFVAYGVLAWLGQRTTEAGASRSAPVTSAGKRDAWAAAAESTRRAAEVDKAVAGENVALAREIEALRNR